MTEATAFSDPGLDDQPLLVEQVEGLLDVYAEVLDQTSASDNYQGILEKLCLMAEKLVPDSCACIMFYDPETRKLYVSAAPSLPREAVIALNGLDLGVGSCGNAVLHRKPMYVSNTYEDARWEDIREFAEFFSIGAGWSQPVMDLDNEVIGTFALSSRETRTPDSFQRRMLEIGASIVGAIFRHESFINGLRHLADHDTLTGASNRRRFENDAALLLNRVQRSKESVSLVFIDIDNFKWINDDYGHDAGDSILQHIAMTFQEQCRSDDLICRWGGDEFIIMIVCDDDCSANAEAMLNRIGGIFETPVSIGIQDIKVKMSCGVSIYPSDAMNLSGLIAGADQAMLQAKANGRNQIVFYHHMSK